jgi:1-acyl-sn-glycerol-3-phosphate acyltransferase
MAPERTSLVPPGVAGEPAGAAGEPAEAAGGRADAAPEARPSPDERPLPDLVRGDAQRVRELLPAIEPERRVNDWGRSERIEGVLDQTLVEFFYRYWFRCEVEGIENVPAEGGALLVSNHSGALPPDAPMIVKAIREEHANPRPVYVTVEHFFKGYPGFSMLVPKIGYVAAHPANVHRLLYDEEELVLVFPEGRKGTEKLYKDRYKLRRFGRGGFVGTAMRARAKLVPVCVIGAEEAAPIFAQVGLMRRLTGLLYFPITPTFPWFGLAGMLGYLPAKFRIRFLEPIDTAELGADPEGDRALVQTVAQEIRARIQENLHDMVARRRSVWLG